jgi:hypothetical protein
VLRDGELGRSSRGRRELQKSRAAAAGRPACYGGGASGGAAPAARPCPDDAVFWSGVSSSMTEVGVLLSAGERPHVEEVRLRGDPRPPRPLCRPPVHRHRSTPARRRWMRVRSDRARGRGEGGAREGLDRTQEERCGGLGFGWVGLFCVFSEK